MVVHVEAPNTTMQHLSALTPTQREQRPLDLSYIHGHIPECTPEP
jgi:hypothetical protein